jgi:hypothetical protein
VPDSCLSDIAPQGNPADRLGALARNCIAGMRPLGAPELAKLGPGSTHRFPFELRDSTRCLRIAAAGAESVMELQVTVGGNQAEPFADSVRGGLALIPARGPICFASPGSYDVAVTMRGRGEVAGQVWQAE